MRTVDLRVCPDCAISFETKQLLDKIWLPTVSCTVQRCVAGSIQLIYIRPMADQPGTSSLLSGHHCILQRPAHSLEGLSYNLEPSRCHRWEQNLNLHPTAAPYAWTPCMVWTVGRWVYCSCGKGVSTKDIQAQYCCLVRRYPAWQLSCECQGSSCKVTAVCCVHCGGCVSSSGEQLVGLVCRSI